MGPKNFNVDPARIEFVAQQPRDDYLNTYHRIDLGLDTLPYNGHTTSLDSFWMGVPVVTLIGETSVGRAGWSQLSNLNLSELAARDEAQFVQIAVDWTSDLTRLADLRAQIAAKNAGVPPDRSRTVCPKYRSRLPPHVAARQLPQTALSCRNLAMAEMTAEQILERALRHEKAGDSNRLAIIFSSFWNTNPIPPICSIALPFSNIRQGNTSRPPWSIFSLPSPRTINDPICITPWAWSCRTRATPHEAIAPLMRALELKPDYAEASNDIGIALATMIACRRRSPCSARPSPFAPILSTP